MALRIGSTEWLARSLFEMQKSSKWEDLAPWLRRLYRDMAREIKVAPSQSRGREEG